MPDRIPAAAVLGGVAPAVGPDAADGGIVSLAARFHPVLSRLRVPLAAGLGSVVWTLRPVATPCLALYALVQPQGDRRLLNRPEFRAMFIDDLVTGSRFGLRAPVYDIVLFGRDWGFSPRDVTVPIRWWHGDADHIVPLAHAESFVPKIPHARLLLRPGESHLGGLGAAREVLDTVLSGW
jgi:pimeloyl-ACP methyl ester carboxylesterase